MDLNQKLSSLHEVSKAKLSKILSTNPNKKYLVLEPSLIRPLERVCSVSWLKGIGVEKIFKLETNSPSFGDFPVFYIIFSNFATFKVVLNQIRSQLVQEQPPKNRYHILLVPRNLQHCDEELEELGLYKIVQVHSFLWLPLHLDVGILSLELPLVYKTTFIQLDYQFLPTLSKTLYHLSFIVGKPKFTLTIGSNAQLILKQLNLLIEHKGDSDQKASDFGGLVILDRSIDYPSVLLTPGTYSALLNEVYGVSSGVCEYKQSQLEDSENDINLKISKQPVHFNLDSNQDSVYCDIRNLYFTEVTAVLSSLTKQLRSEKVQSKEMALDQIKRYVQTQLQATNLRKRNITNHLLAAETIIQVLGPRYENQQQIELNIMKNSNRNTNLTYLEDSLSTEDDICVSLRLFCLISITQKLNNTEIRSFWRKFLHQFGYKYGITFRNLINANLIQEFNTGASLQSKLRLPKFTGNEFYNNVNKLKQVPSNGVNLKCPTCASYVFGGSYIPLIVQVVNLLLNATPLVEVRNKLEGLGVVGVQNDGGYPLEKRSVLVFVVGGVTYAEIAACNLLENLTGSRIVLMSDRVVSGRDIAIDLLS